MQITDNMKYKRVLLKLSGESLGGHEGRGIDEGMLARYAAEVAAAVRSGVQVAIVVGGGNIFRGLQSAVPEWTLRYLPLLR